MSDTDKAIKDRAREDVRFTNDVLDEVERARRAFPQPNPNLAALQEEVGELAKAIMSQSSGEVYREAVQVASMALRVATEGDPYYDHHRLKAGLDEHPSKAKGYAKVVRSPDGVFYAIDPRDEERRVGDGWMVGECFPRAYKVDEDMIELQIPGVGLVNLLWDTAEGS